MLSKLMEGDAMANDGSPITWQEDGQVAPTNISSANLTYHIKLPKPMAVDRLLSLERADPKGVHAKDGKGEWLHGQGCAVLKLADINEMQPGLGLVYFVCRAHYPHRVTCIGIGVAMNGLDLSILGEISLLLKCGIWSN